MVTLAVLAAPDATQFCVKEVDLVICKTYYLSCICMRNRHMTFVQFAYCLSLKTYLKF